MVTRKTLWSQEEEDMKHFVALCVSYLHLVLYIHFFLCCTACPQHILDWQEWQNNEIGADYLYFTRCSLTFPLYSTCPSKIIRTVTAKWETCRRKKFLSPLVTGNHLFHSGNMHTIHRLYKQKSQLHDVWFLLFLNLSTFDLYSMQADIKPSRECKTTKNMQDLRFS